MKLSVYQVQHICSYRPKEKSADYYAKKNAVNLEEHHVEYIKAESTLLKQSGRTLAERACIFEAKFPEKKLSAK